MRWTKDGLEYEADPRQAEKLIEELGLNGAKGLSTPAVKPSIGNIRGDKPLPDDKVTHFRALAARANYLSADRPECQFAAKEICRFMAAPTMLSADEFANTISRRMWMAWTCTWTLTKQDACVHESLHVEDASLLESIY